MKGWLFMQFYNRINQFGTLANNFNNNSPSDVFPTAINWMRGMSILVDQGGFKKDSLYEQYRNVVTRKFEIVESNTILQQLMFSAHYCAALRSLQSVENKADVSRIGIITWYYGIYSAARAMITALDGSFKEDHTSTARIWYRQIVLQDWIQIPFNLKVTTLESSRCNEELKKILDVPVFEMIGNSPSNNEQAYGAIHAYLSNSSRWWRQKITNELRYRKQDTLNEKLNTTGVGFMHQAFRYRGEANYRDFFYLGFGQYKEKELTQFLTDLSQVLESFVSAAGIFCSRRLGNAEWGQFLFELDRNRSFSLATDSLW